MEYTPERPSEDGFYFVRGDDFMGLLDTVVRVDMSFGQLFLDGEWISMTDFERSWPSAVWAGPIQEPS